MTDTTKIRNFDLLSYEKATKKMVARNENSYNNYGTSLNTSKSYSLEEIQSVVKSGNLLSQMQLSQAFFLRDGFYKHLVMHYATLLTYAGLLIPNPSYGNKLSTSHIEKRYYNALDYVDDHFRAELMTNWSVRALVDGSYYGVIQSLSREDFAVLDLPAHYSRSRFRDMYGNDIIEFDVTYFNTITNETDKEQALSAYPKVVSSFYKKYQKGKTSTSWVKIPPELCICFSFAEDNKPFFLNVIEATLRYDEAVDTERERELEEIRKIIVQKVPHLNDGTLLFEPEEAAAMHDGSVKMLKGNKNISVLTTYTDVDSIVSRTSAESSNNHLEKMLHNVFSEAGTSSEIFAPTGSQSLSTSIINDISIMMIIGNKYSRYLSFILNKLFGNKNITFRFKILPISLHNRSDYITDSFKLAQSGYSYLLPSVAMGLSQKELVNIKELENDVLDLGSILKPLASAYTQSSNEAGAPEKKLEEKSEKTIQNEKSIDNQGGSN